MVVVSGAAATRYSWCSGQWCSVFALRVYSLRVDVSVPLWLVRDISNTCETMCPTGDCKHAPSYVSGFCIFQTAVLQMASDHSIFHRGGDWGRQGRRQCPGPVAQIFPVGTRRPPAFSGRLPACALMPCWGSCLSVQVQVFSFIFIV